MSIGYALCEYLLVPYPLWSSSYTNVGVSDFVQSVFPATVVIVTIITTLFGYMVCGGIPLRVRSLKKFSLQPSELWFLFSVSLAEVLLGVVYIITRADIWYMLAFALEVGYCVWESLSRRLPVEFLTHHVCTWISIFLSLQVVGMDVRLLVQLSLAVGIANAIVCGTKLWYRNSVELPGRLFRKKVGLFLSLYSSIYFRIFISFVNVGWISWYMLLASQERPGWMRMYLTCLWMLLALNVQLTFSIYRLWVDVFKTYT
jgi:hypothetical protein